MARTLSYTSSVVLAGTAAVIGWHLPVAFQLGMRSHWVHDLEDLSFLVAYRAGLAESGKFPSVAHGFVPLPCHAAL
jgi:hypothetical protein